MKCAAQLSKDLQTKKPTRTNSFSNSDNISSSSESTKSKPEENLNQKNWAFLYSALAKKGSKSFSYLAFFPIKQVSIHNFQELSQVLRAKNLDWFGFLGYELAGDIEKLSLPSSSFINLPKGLLISFAVVIEFNHEKQEVVVNYYEEKHLNYAKNLLQKAQNSSPEEDLSANLAKSQTIISTGSNFSDEEYLSAIDEIRKKISAGDLFQTNLTRKFFGEFEHKISAQTAFKMFFELVNSSPVNYSSFFALDNLFVISASPELFLKVKNKKIISQPIKGTAPRGKNPQEDKKIKESLKNSLKEKAENLMIVDLMRNDFSRFCVAGSVKVQNLFKLSTYQNLHHLSSEIHGKILPELDNVDVLAACFPPGSMTGAPKIKAIEVAANYEKLARGVYSGCIGYFKGNDEMNLAVVIRTAVLQDKKFEFQAGGAITYESEAQKELEEVFVKSRNIKELLFL